MKKIIVLILMIIMIFPKNILALGSISLNTDYIEIIKGQSDSFNVTFDNTAGRINITSLDTNVVSVNSSSLFLDKDSKTITLDGNEVGSSVINVYVYDASTYDYEDLSNTEYNLNVRVLLPGDMNKNDMIDLGDITLLLRRYLTFDISDGDKKLGDINNNNCIDLNDIIMLLHEYIDL